MASPLDLDSLRPALEALALCRHRGLRERLLFEAIWGMDLAGALALWRRSEPRGRLCRVLARGDPDSLSGETEIEAVLAGDLPAELPGARLVLATPAGAAGGAELIVAFGARDAGEEAIDLVEAILHLWAVITAADPAHDAGDCVPSPTADRAALRSEGHRLAHDLRNLLFCITGNQELSSQCGEDERLTLEGQIERDVDRAATLLGQAFGHPPGQAAPTHAALVREVCASERPLATAAGIELALVVAPDAETGRAVWSDLELERVLRNLLVNARRALAERGEHIEVRWSRDAASGYRLAVRDDGPEPPEELAPGLGLTSVRTLSEEAGGSLTWRGLPTGGAEFQVSVPAAGRDPALPRDTRAGPPDPQENR